MGTARGAESGVPVRRSWWQRVLRLPMTRVEGVLWAVALLGWAGTAVAAHVGWIAWPTATMVAIAWSLPSAVHQLVHDDEDD